MARDPLQVLLTVRRRAVEQARFAMAACLMAEAAVSDRLGLIDALAKLDREASGAWQDAHQFLQMSSLRLEAVRAERQTVAADFAAATSRSAQARGVVTAARLAAEAVEQLLGEREAARRVESARREQHVQDDIARARLAARRRGEAS